jgi:polysaccharide chain length determinant protein (PEP-CTERM system associated)
MLAGKTYTSQDYLTLLKRYWWIVVCTTAVGAFTALLISSTRKDVYQSNMLVQILPQRVPNSYVQSTVTVGTEERMGSLTAQVKSRSQLERLIREFGLYKEELATTPMEDVVGLMQTAIDVNLVRPQSRQAPAEAFTLRFTYGDPDLAARVTSALGNLFIALNARERNDLAKTANTFFESQLVEAKKRLEDQEAKVERFRQQHAGRLPTQSEFNLQAMSATQTSLTSQVESLARDRDRRMTLERTYNDRLNTPLPVSPVAASPTATVDPSGAAVVPLAQQLQTARVRLESLEARLKPEHPDLRRQQRVVSELERRMATEKTEPGTAPDATSAGLTPEAIQRREQLQTLKADIESLDRQIAFKESEVARLRREIADYQGRLEATPGVESEWISLTRDYETLKSSYEELLRKSEASKVSEDLERRQVGEVFKIVDSASVPVRPVGSIRLTINAAGTGLGFAIGAGILVLFFVRDKTFHSEGDVLDVVRLPVLAIVPFVMDKAEERRRKRFRTVVAGAAAATTVASGYVAYAMELWKYVR